MVHPAVLAEKYDRNYRPYFLGERGAASLNQYFGMQQILPELKDNTAVYVVSPQWFTKKGYDSSAFQQFFNSDQLNSLLPITNRMLHPSMLQSVCYNSIQMSPFKVL